MNVELDDYLYWLEQQATKYQQAADREVAAGEYGRGCIAAAHASAYRQATGRFRYRVVGRSEFPMVPAS